MDAVREGRKSSAKVRCKHPGDSIRVAFIENDDLDNETEGEDDFDDR